MLLSSLTILSPFRSSFLGYYLLLSFSFFFFFRVPILGGEHRTTATRWSVTYSIHLPTFFFIGNTAPLFLPLSNNSFSPTCHTSNTVRLDPCLTQSRRFS